MLRWAFSFDPAINVGGVADVGSLTRHWGKEEPKQHGEKKPAPAGPERARGEIAAITAAPAPVLLKPASISRLAHDCHTPCRQAIPVDTSSIRNQPHLNCNGFANALLSALFRRVDYFSEVLGYRRNVPGNTGLEQLTRSLLI